MINLRLFISVHLFVLNWTAKIPIVIFSWAALALQHVDVHLATEWVGIDAINHLHTGTSITCQCQSVDAIAKYQAVHNGCVPKTLQGALFATDTLT
jgi:hypothetical protein